MGSFSVSDAEKFESSQGGSGFFSLKNDKDVARVRFLFNDIDGVQCYSVHQVEVDGKKRYVNCLREYGDPVDACPFCREQKFINMKYFIPLYNIDTQNTQIWERGRKFGSKLTSMCSRYPNIVSHIFEIERNGKPKDTQTTYEIYETGEDGTTLEDFDTVQNPLGTVVLVKTAEEMENYLSTGDFDGSGAPVRRQSQSADDGGYQRRTPANGDGRRRAF